MSTRRLTDRLEARVAAVEQAMNDTTGAAVFFALVALGSLADRHCPVVAVDINRNGQRVRVDRNPDEPLNLLFRRSNPSGGWRTCAVPIFEP